MNYLKGFNNYLEDMDKSERTIVSYLNTISQFSNWLIKEKFIDDLSIVATREIKAYRQILLEKYSPATVNQKLACIKTFYKFMTQTHIIKEDPAKYIKLQKVDNIKSQYMTRAEELRVMSKAKEKGIKAYAILMVLLKCGLRPSELSSLTLDCLFLDKEPTLLVKDSKRNKSRYVPIPMDTCKALNAWIDERNKSDKIYHTRSKYVFTSQRQDRLEVRAIQRVVEVIGIEAGVELYCIRLRATYANSLIQNANIPLSALATLMGHDSIQTTSRYTTINEQDKRRYVNSISEI
ncbi:tyrosine-type recombinase/integrase [Evansella cellulosilytica]|uniref:Integrase family protein n=1 Tax=Evansella cellulosilytica (strain ATCC 21833 / DSM 2522 / FERM P-1141 / JCM 9156 / N-4) TaxID=649639 RepID=E6TZV3_EVAC2|nr:tyrosine-type recombinase/integrase [Evansella cellulosilytica]ADU32519.1 integrase family protein [Evansella cellulosilytica DSM 2522]